MRRHVGSLYLLLQLWILPTRSLKTIDGIPQTTSQFTSWYGQYGYVFRDILHNNCSRQYNNYLYGTEANLTVNWSDGANYHSIIVEPVIQCILENTSEYVKSEMSSAQVLLGLAPTIIALLGPSSSELALLTVVARRPILAGLLALACPAVYLSRAFERGNPLDILADQEGRLRQWRPRGWKSILLGALQHLIVLIALTNIATLYYQLGVKTICMFWPNATVAPVVWGLLVLPVHLIGVTCFRLQARRFTRSETKEETSRRSKTPREFETIGRDNQRQPKLHRSFGQWVMKSPERVYVWVKTWLVPATSQDPIYIVQFDESYTQVIINWVLSAAIVAHVIFGTIVLSSLTFIGPKDALGVVGRFAASVLVCRAVLMHEVAGIRENVHSDGGFVAPPLSDEGSLMDYCATETAPSLRNNQRCSEEI
ncbi:hypothetical protein F4861DRAFT_110434 [Xylaria intraflava]|nr:hypothetical protein F4861DRAFT_110434 [Xylaria intraflava]